MVPTLTPKPGSQDVDQDNSDLAADAVSWLRDKRGKFYESALLRESVKPYPVTTTANGDGELKVGACMHARARVCVRTRARVCMFACVSVCV